ncbi:serine hydrolase domain-containing protein [Salmonirosea aquatica]|uniref:Serine hydrolase n=1 Tax=Salmonirosea aquatica TaxID=2654236 RepID=A0A7C9FQQ8_9BACT|nr:serine hydrolase [Cytophagaceae bacterium SJW1-29]
MKPFVYTLFLVAYLLAGPCSVQAQTPPLSAKADSLFTEWNKPGMPGASVGVVHQGKLIYAKGFGEADLETGAPITPETIFHVASVSKQFTAYAIVLLAQQGKLALDDDIRKYVPEVPDFGKTITLRHLLNHTSGLRDQWNLLAMSGRGLDDVITKDHIFNLIKRQRELNFEPGSAYAYCNTGYTLLAEIVSRVSKQTFPDWMQQNVFQPLGMKSTLFYDNNERLVKGRAYSFHRTPGLGTFSKSPLNYANVGATSLFTTVQDLARWVDNFRTPKVGAPGTMVQMLERGRLTNGDTLAYALGLTHGQYQGISYYGHNGADAGFRSALAYFPKEDYGFIVLSNQAEFNSDRKAMELASLYLAPYLREEKKAAPPVANGDYKFDSTLFRNYTGSYELAEASGFILKFRREGDRYFTQATGQSEVEMFPSSDSTFFLKVVEASVIFHRTKAGPVSRITLQQNGNHPGTRVQPTEAPEVKREQIVGKYYSPELETIYTIVQEGATLRLIHVQHGEVPLKIVSKDKLQAPWWFVQNIELVRDSADKVVGLRMSNGRVQNLWFQRLSDDFAAEMPPGKGK